MAIALWWIYPITPVQEMLFKCVTEPKHSKQHSRLYLQPLSIMTDFEQKLQSWFQTVFPGVDNSGCLFHFNQAVLRKVNLIGLKAAYEEKPINPVTGRRGTSATKKHIRRACALAFVPAQDVPAAWDEISQQFPVSDKCDAFVTYFEITWVGRRNTNVPTLSTP